MKNKKIIFCLFIFCLSQIASFGNDFFPPSFSVGMYYSADGVAIKTSSDPFGGDCTYKIAVDRVEEQQIYLKASFESQAKCMGEGAKATITIKEQLPEGFYTIHVLFTDLYGDFGNFTTDIENVALTQTNFSFTDDDMQWSYMTSAEFEDWIVMTTTYKYFGDSVVNGITYKKMFKSTDNELTWNELGLVREAEKRVYFIPREEDTERLIYRFDYVLNETSLFWPTREINYIDTIDIAGSSKARLAICRNLNAIDEYIDGPMYLLCFDDCVVEDIGGLYTPSFDDLPCGYYCPGAQYNTTLLCVRKGNDIIFHAPLYDECYYYRLKTAIDDFATNNTISPNPVSDILYLNNTTGNPECSIINTNGTVVWKGWAENNQINVSSLPAGVYLLKIGNGETHRFVKK